MKKNQIGRKVNSPIIAFALFGLLAPVTHQPSYAMEAVRINFASTSYCSGYAGKSNNFVIGLSKGQDLNIGLRNNKPMRVVGPSGDVVPFKKESARHLMWQINETADYQIQFLGDDWTLFDVCAIDTPDQPVFNASIGA